MVWAKAGDHASRAKAANGRSVAIITALRGSLAPTTFVHGCLSFFAGRQPAAAVSASHI